MMSTHAAADIVEKMTTSMDLKSALSAFGYVVGTTARLGRQRQAVQSPRKLAKTLVPLSVENQVAILFGPEDKGLSNEEIRFCHALVNIPTAEFSSLNLAQAVMILCYELFLVSRNPVPESLPRLANAFELEGMYDHLGGVLMKIGFINPQNPEHWMWNVRRFLSRIPLRAREEEPLFETFSEETLEGVPETFDALGLMTEEVLGSSLTNSISLGYSCMPRVFLT